MAYATDIALINSVQVSAQAMGVAASWSSGTPVNVKDDFLYELYLLFRLIDALNANYDVEYIPGAGAKAHEFPKKPADKAGKPRFHVKDRTSQTVLFQLCAGTKAADRNGDERGLDLSIQTAASSDAPKAVDVLQIFDAKYRTDNAARITHPEFSAFAHWVELFDLRGMPNAGLMFGALNDLNANCLVTNGDPSTELDVECTRVSVREVSDFHPHTPAHSVRP
jgi:hypothetical protein